MTLINNVNLIPEPTKHQDLNTTEQVWLIQKIYLVAFPYTCLCGGVFPLVCAEQQQVLGIKQCFTQVEWMHLNLVDAKH